MTTKKTLCGCGHHARAHQITSRELGSAAGRYGIRGQCGDCPCSRYTSAALDVALAKRAANPEKVRP